MEFENTRVIVEDHGPVWQVRINAPERRNALNPDLIRLLDAGRIGRAVAIDVLRLGRARSFTLMPVERRQSS